MVSDTVDQIATELAVHIKESGRGYLIQGQQHASFDEHRKPTSLDVWLRRWFCRNLGASRDTTRATNSMVGELVATQKFVEGTFKCPDTDKGTPCKGIRLSRPT